MFQLFKRTLFITFLAVAPAIALEFINQYFQNSSGHPDITSKFTITMVILITLIIAIIAIALFIKDRFVSTK